MDPASLPLRDIRLPDPVSWWPPAPGWWLLLMLLVAGVLLAAWLRRHKQRSAGRRLALQELAQLRAAYEQHDDARKLAAALSRLLRRAAIQVDPGAAGLTGDDWLHWLDRQWGRQDFTSDTGRQLIEAPYRPGTDCDGPGLLRLCERWLQQLPGGARRS